MVLLHLLILYNLQYHKSPTNKLTFQEHVEVLQESPDPYSLFPLSPLRKGLAPRLNPVCPFFDIYKTATYSSQRPNYFQRKLPYSV